MSSIVVSFRTTTEDLAKALDGLLKTTNTPSDFNSISNIIRATYFHGILKLCDDPTIPPSNESIEQINLLVNQNKRRKTNGK